MNSKAGFPLGQSWVCVGMICLLVLSSCTDVSPPSPTAVPSLPPPPVRSGGPGSSLSKDDSYDPEGELLYSGTSKSINFTAETPGNYTLNVEGNEMVIEVKEFSIDSFYINLAIVIIVGFVLYN